MRLNEVDVRPAREVKTKQRVFNGYRNDANESRKMLKKTEQKKIKMSLTKALAKAV